ncbi:TPA: peroxiredoxin [Serratia liquefaciens]|nr:peroxiredoxin [Serratia liquefaciens]
MGNPALLPDDLPCPVDDGAADHLVGMPMPALRFHSTFGERVDLSILPGRTVVYAYPRTGELHGNLPAGWDAIPGARGCTAQTLSFQAEKDVFTTFGIRIFGLSTQTTDYQRELSDRLRLTFPILSDAEFALVNALRLPTMNVEGMRLIKRLTLIIRDGTIEHVFYPVFPANRAAAEVIGWLRDHPDLAPGTLD